jgi:cell division septation protein DedD
MQIDIPAHIEKLLFLHEALVIPGFGGFTATRTPATADYVGGTVSSPSKTLSFSENLTIDDGILVNDIILTHGISAEDAQRVVAEFVEKMQSLLSQREIVTLPGVGRLYKNYIQKIQFLPDATNFNAASYGLPPLQFSPIARSREVGADPATVLPNEGLPAPESAASITPPPMPEATVSPQRRGNSSLGSVLGIVFLLASLTAGIWYWQQKKKEAKGKGETQTEQVSSDQEAVENNKSKEVLPESDKTEQREPTVEESLEKRTADVRNQLKNGRLAILVVATLSHASNAEKLMNMLKEEGFDVYHLQKNGHQVGIQFYYTNPDEIKEKIATLTQLTGEKNILVKRK